MKLGKPARLLVGLGGVSSTVSNIQQQTITPDILDHYLGGVVGYSGAGDAWPEWNTGGDYARLFALQADSVGAVPMFTLYQMAAKGDGNLSGINETAFMTQYWAQVKLMYQKIATFNKPALVNLEPDFWGYVQQTTNSNPASLPAVVSANPDCATYANNVVGIAGCLVHMARVYAPKAYVGFPPSNWGAFGNVSAVVSFMNAVGANQADFIVAQTSDRDGGCFEVTPQPGYCTRTSAVWYWGQTQFNQHFAEVSAWHVGLGGLPVIWWQTPLGVASNTPGGTPLHYRDNRVDYFLTHPADLIAAGGLGVVFGEGEINQTNLTTDGGQFKRLSTAYFLNPATLP